MGLITGLKNKLNMKQKQIEIWSINPVKNYGLRNILEMRWNSGIVTMISVDFMEHEREWKDVLVMYWLYDAEIFESVHHNLFGKIITND
jgi:hypothetical protein